MYEHKWQELRSRLIALGWRPEIAEGIEGLSSPHDAMFLDARVFEREFREQVIFSLSRQIATILEYKGQGFYPPETARAQQDFQQALDCLQGI